MARMKITIVPNSVSIAPGASTRISLFESPGPGTIGSVGTGVLNEFVSAVGRTAATRAWDLAALAMAAIAADRHFNRAAISEDGWTRVIDLTVAVSDPGLWGTLKPLVGR